MSDVHPELADLEARGADLAELRALASDRGALADRLRALGLTDVQARGSVRIGFGRYTTPDELERAAKALNEAAAAQAAP